MPDNKKQHFVPKFLLKHFASDAKQLQISLVNISRGKLVHEASLRDQCYRDYFYGAPELDAVLAQVEGDLATTVNLTIAANKITARDGQNLALLMVLQRGRTARAVERINAQTDMMAKLYLNGKFAPEMLRKFRITFDNAARMSLSLSFKLMPMTFDLKRILIINRTKTPFVLSDNPVISTNWFGRKNYPGRSLLGYANAGLQMAMPLSPRYTLLMHDSNVYSAPGVETVLELEHTETVDALNDLQWLNADKNIYVPPGFNEAQLARFMALKRDETLVNFRRMEETKPGRYRLNGKDEYAGPNEDFADELVGFSERELPQDIRIKGITLRKNPKFNNDGSMASPRRDHAWFLIADAFADHLEERKVGYGDLWTYVIEHPLFRQVGPWLPRHMDRALAEADAERAMASSI